MNTSIGIYPYTQDPSFQKKISHKKEFYDNRIDNRNKDIYCLEPQQRFLRNFINPLTHYNSILVNHSVGVGKTLSAISIAENFKKTHKILVLTKNKTLELNFRKELLSICNEYRLLENPEKEYSKYYSFMTYSKLTNRVLGHREEKKRVFKKGAISNVSNTVVICDEIHNVTGNDSYFALLKLLKRSENVKLILLTATVIYDSIKEIFEISNLLNYDSKVLLPIRNELIKEKLIFFTKTNEKNIISKNIPYLTEKGKEHLIDFLKGKVSYLVQDKKFFPSLHYGKNGKKSVSLSECIMSSFQDYFYKNSLMNSSNNDSENVLFKDSSDAATIVYPDGTYGSTGFIKNILKSKDHTFLKKENIKKYSCKIFNILEIIEKSKGICFIYSNFVTNGGIQLLEMVLKKNGYSEYGTRGTKPKFVTISEGMSNKTKEKIIKTINSKENIYGKEIKILLGSYVISEGISFKNIRQIHILEPYWNFSRIEQIIGRGARFRSHALLNPKDRKVDIYLHSAISKTTDSIDLLKYQLSFEKNKSAKEVTKIISKIAIDCPLNQQRNKVDCEYNLPEKPKIDTTTYFLLSHSKEEYVFIMEKIQELFTLGSVFLLKDIVEYINTKGIFHHNNIYYVLNDMIYQRVTIKDHYNRECHIIPIKNFYIANPVDSDIQEPLVYKFYKKKQIQKEIEANSNINRVKDKKTLYKFQNTKIFKNPGIYATYLNKLGVIDGVLRIIDTRNDDLDARKKVHGKVCEYYQKEELEEIFRYLEKGISLPKMPKSDLCYILENILKEKKLIVM
ncbi:MAG TPA: DEAD/DEAH box helicase family protein [Allocoleopsis sp.]